MSEDVRMITLRDVISLMDDSELWNDKKVHGVIYDAETLCYENEYISIVVNGLENVILPIGHPMLIPYYDNVVSGIGSNEDTGELEVCLFGKDAFPAGIAGR